RIRLRDPLGLAARERGAGAGAGIRARQRGGVVPPVPLSRSAGADGRGGGRDGARGGPRSPFHAVRERAGAGLSQRTPAGRCRGTVPSSREGRRGRSAGGARLWSAVSRAPGKGVRRSRCVAKLGRLI